MTFTFFLITTIIALGILLFIIALSEWLEKLYKKVRKKDLTFIKN